jgi:hypothetical protein
VENQPRRRFRHGEFRYIDFAAMKQNVPDERAIPADS